MSNIGGGIFFNTPKKVNESFNDIFKKSQKSEKELIDEYNKYVKIYKKHISNLDELDNYIVEDNYNFDSFRKSFEIIKNKINDKKNPLLLTNYEEVPKNNFSDDIIEYHLLQQIKYLLDYNYSDEKRELIKLVSIRNVKTSPEFKVFSIENKETEYLPLFHNNFQLDYSKMKSIFDQVIKYITGTVQQIQINAKQKTKKIKSPNANPLLKKTKISLIRKSKVKSKKKIEDINIPIHNEVLPVIQIKMPKKISNE